MKEIDQLKKAILEEYPRMNEQTEFCFKCHKDVPCFNVCCSDVNIFLTPYDIIRLKKRLGMTSGEFLAKYTIMPAHKNAPYPIIQLQMRDDENKTCPFVSDEGCTVYEDRPWPCRMYPLGLASPKDDPENVEKEFHFLLKEAECKGHEEDHTQTVAEWLADQGIEEYNELGELFKQITLHDFFGKGGKLDEKKINMFFTACYNIDKFRDFVFGSSFLEKFQIDEETRNRIESDDVELLRFGYKWLRFALFGEPTMKINVEILERRKAEQAAAKKKPE